MQKERKVDVSLEPVEDGRWRATTTAYALRVAKHWDMSLFWTPGASSPQWIFDPLEVDERVATVADFLEAEGYSDLEGFEDDDTFSIVVEAPDERPWEHPLKI